MNRFFKKHLGVFVTVGPTVLWLGIFLLIPLAYVILMTVLTKNLFLPWKITGISLQTNISRYLGIPSGFPCRPR